MQAMSERGGAAVPSDAAAPGRTVPLMVQPEALMATAVRLDEIAANLASCLERVTPKLTPAPPGNDEVSRSNASALSQQANRAQAQINHGINELNKAAERCRTSAKQYQQTDESFGSTAARQ